MERSKEIPCGDAGKRPKRTLRRSIKGFSKPPLLSPAQLHVRGSELKLKLWPISDLSCKDTSSALRLFFQKIYMDCKSILEFVHGPGVKACFPQPLLWSCLYSWRVMCFMCASLFSVWQVVFMWLCAHVPYPPGRRSYGWSVAGSWAMALGCSSCWFRFRFSGTL